MAQAKGMGVKAGGMSLEMSNAASEETTKPSYDLYFVIFPSSSFKLLVLRYIALGNSMGKGAAFLQSKLWCPDSEEVATYV